jgi:hypothetical protein
MPFGVVFVFADDQWRVLLEQSKLQGGIRDADLFRDRFLTLAAGAVEQISSRLRPLSTLLAFLSR